jgi:hypothetical protein
LNELNEIRFADNRILLEDNLVLSAILPRGAAELDRDIVIKSNCVIEGAVYARNFRVENGPSRVCGAVFIQIELHVNSDASGVVTFERSVGSAGAIVSHSPACRMQFLADIHACQVRLRNAYVAASIFADEIVLEDCVVVGGAFATRNLEMTNCVLGTFNAPTVRAAQSITLLLPSGFSVEPISCLPGTEFRSLALADLGALMRGVPEAPNSGSVPISVETDQQRAVLVDGDTQQILHSYSIAGKVLAADLLDFDRLQNHFVLSAAALGPQLLRAYDLGQDAGGQKIELTPERVSAFLFDILHGKISVSTLDGRFSLADFLPVKLS